MNLRKFRTSSMIVLGLVTALVVGGCSDGYDSPETAENAAVQGAATNVLVEPATLKSWMDKGMVNNQNGFDENVVILDFNSKDPLRIPGACRVSGGELTTTRFEGVGDASPMVATGEQMDAVLQRLGIDENSTIVFTSSGSGYYPTRAYWTFRYWGFPKERLKLLNGGNKAFAAKYESLMTEEAPNPEPSTYSVRDLPTLNDDLRASVGEMVMLIDGLPENEENIVLDARGKDPVPGDSKTNSGYFGTSATPGKLGGDYVVVDGHPVGGNYLNQGDLFENGKFKSAEKIEALFREKGWTPGKKVTVYCTTGYSATPLFFAVDAILGGNAQLYDGSWSQLGKYSDYTAAGGELPPGSPWAIDSYLDPDTVRYNFRYLETTDAGYKIETLQLNKEAEAKPPFADTRDPNSDNDVATNQVEDADAAYVGTGTPVQFSSIVATDATNGVLIDKATLQGWMDADLVNAAQGSNRVVILDVTDPVSYQKGHIPGAQLWDVSEHAETRVEGPAPAVNMVVTGDKMDELIQSHGIDEFTTIVITSSKTATYFPSRAYFLLRYYGFPKDNLKVLNGYNGAWDPAELVSTATTLEPSDLSVKDIANHRPDLRVSLPELMDALEDNRGVPVDFRGVKTAAASTPGVFSDVPGDYVVFEGQLKGGKGFVWKNFNVNHDGKDIDEDGEADPVDLSYKNSSDIATALNGIGLDETQLVYSYCRTGYIASTGFFVLDGILGWPVMAYDGSWSQFGKMSSNKDMGGELPEGSEWATDNATYMNMDTITYNKAATREEVIEPLNPDADALALHPEDANQIEDEDTDYQEQASGNEESGGAPTQTQPGPSIGC